MAVARRHAPTGKLLEGDANGERTDEEIQLTDWSDEGEHLGRASLHELVEELRSRSVDPMVLSKSLDIPIFVRTKKVPVYTIGSPSSLRLMALLILGTLSLGFISLIGYLAVSQREIPDLISGLAGSCIGAIAGILTGTHNLESADAARPSVNLRDPTDE